MTTPDQLSDIPEPADPRGQALSLLGRRLRALEAQGHYFRNRHSICPFVLDFACPEAKLAIELDSGLLALPSPLEQARARVLATQGYRVLRFSLQQVLDETDAVMTAIARELATGRE